MEFDKIMNGSMTCSICRKRFADKTGVCKECWGVVSALSRGNKCEVCGEFSLGCQTYAGDQIIDGDSGIMGTEFEFLKAYLLCPNCADKIEKFIIKHEDQIEKGEQKEEVK